MSDRQRPQDDPLYSKRINDKFTEYAWLQRQDVFDSLLETSRISRRLFDEATTAARPSRLLAGWIELGSAYLHYSSALIGNTAGLVAGLGYEIREGKPDTLYPHRVVDFEKVLAREPRLKKCWKVGHRPGDPGRLPSSAVTFWQSASNMASPRWDVVFDLSGDPPGEDNCGTYCLELDIGDSVKEVVREYVYLCPQPSRPARR